MAGVKFMVMYPRPQDIDAFEKLYQDELVPIGDGLSSEYAITFEAFEKLYQEEHVPMVVEKLVGKTRFVSTKIVTTLNGTRVSMAPVPLLQLGVGHVLTFPLIVWNLALNAHILREALSTRFAVGLSVALVYIVILWQITEHIVKGALPH